MKMQIKIRRLVVIIANIIICLSLSFTVCKGIPKYSSPQGGEIIVTGKFSRIT